MRTTANKKQQVKKYEMKYFQNSKIFIEIKQMLI